MSEVAERRLPFNGTVKSRGRNFPAISESHRSAVLAIQTERFRPQNVIRGFLSRIAAADTRVDIPLPCSRDRVIHAGNVVANEISPTIFLYT